MDFEAIRGGLERAVPFSAHLGLRIAEVGPGHGVVVLPDDGRLRNYTRTQHAAALFAAGQVAAGAACVGAFAETIADIQPLATRASIEYHHVARGEIVATASVTENAEGLVARLRDEGAVGFPAHVELRDRADRLVAQLAVDWRVTPRGAAGSS